LGNGDFHGSGQLDVEGGGDVVVLAVAGGCGSSLHSRFWVVVPSVSYRCRGCSERWFVCFFLSIFYSGAG